MRKHCLALAFLLPMSVPAMAQGMAAMPGMNHDHAAMGANHMHDMPGTVVKADPKTGLMDVNSHGHVLRLHYPPAALAGIKPGDKVTLQLGFTKP